MENMLIHPAYTFYEGEDPLLFLLVLIGVFIHAELVLWLVGDVRSRGKAPLPWGVAALFLSPVVRLLWLRQKNVLDSKRKEKDARLPVREWRFHSFSWKDVPARLLLMIGTAYAVFVVAGHAHGNSFPGGSTIHLVMALVLAGLGLAMAFRWHRQNLYIYRYTCPACRHKLPRTKERLTPERLRVEIGDHCPRCGHGFFEAQAAVETDIS